MPKFYMLVLVKKNFAAKPEVRICNEEYIPNKGEKHQDIGLFEELEDAETARATLTDTVLVGYWGKKRYLECRNGRIGFSNVARRREFFAKFVR